MEKNDSQPEVENAEQQQKWLSSKSKISPTRSLTVDEVAERIASGEPIFIMTADQEIREVVAEKVDELTSNGVRSLNRPVD